MDTPNDARWTPCEAPGCDGRGTWAYTGAHRLCAAHHALQQVQNSIRGIAPATCTLAVAGEAPTPIAW